MVYDIRSFIAECQAIIKVDGGSNGREKVRMLLEKLLRDDEFIRKHCVDAPAGHHLLFEDSELGFQVLVHMSSAPRVSPPHDHGASWAIYGQAIAHTDVTEWERTDDRLNPAHADLKSKRSYRLTPGHAGIYQDGIIHSVSYPAKSCFVRVTGTNLDNIPRAMFDLKTGAVTRMTPLRAG
jgi:predicted metal-dependent enzyme (double-stranded beta helix superfamily)